MTNIQIMYARGPNVLNLNVYTNQDDQYPEYEGQEEDPNIDSQAIEEQFEAFVKDIQRYDEIITKVGKNVDEASAEEYFITEFYPTFAFECTYDKDEEKQIIANSDPQMAKMMENLERGNKNLKEQLKSWLFQFSKKTRLTEVLITENKVLRKYVSQKNKDIVKLIETIKNAQNQELIDLKQNLNELKEENGVLLDHLKSIKEELKEKVDEQKKLVAAYEKTEREKVEIQKKITQGEDEEEHYSKMVALLEGSIQETKRREKKLLNQKNRLEKLKSQYLEDQQVINKQIQQCQIDRDDIENHLKKKFKGHQTQKQKIMDEIEDLTQKIQRAKQETKDFQQQISKNQHRIDQYTNLTKDIDKKITQMSETIQTGQKALDNILEAQTQYMSDIDMINFDIDVLKEELKELEEKQGENQSKFKKQMKTLEDEKRQQISKWNQQLNKTQREVSMKILQQKSDLAIKKREVEDVQRKVTDKKTEIQELRSQMREIKQNQVLMTTLRQKLKAAENK